MDMSTADDPAAATAAEPGDSETAFLLKYLETHDAVCPLCRYNLRGLTVPRCPECGREVRLAVGLTEPHLRGLVIFLVALCLSAGCGFMCFLIMGGELVRSQRWPSFGHEWALLFLFYGTMVSIIPTVMSIFLCRRFMRLEKPVQYLLAGLAWAWDALLVLILLGLIFRIIR
jgi:hypothetical protein